MELATFIVAVFAVGISLAALVFTWRQDIRAKKQDKRLVDIEERDQKRFEQEMTADPHAELVDFSKMAKTNFRSYAFVITNTGKESASDLDLQLMDDSGNAVSQPERIGVLAQGGFGESPRQCRRRGSRSQSPSPETDLVGPKRRERANVPR